MPIAAWTFARRRGVTLRRIRVRTALLLMLVAGALLGVNLRERACNYYGAPAQLDKIECFCRGWPCDTLREWPNHFSAELVTEIEKFGIVMDVVVAALLLFTLALVCEAHPGAVSAPKSSTSRRSANCIRT